MLTKKDILHYLSDHKQELEKEVHLSKIALFGSFALGEETDTSDIDLLIEFKPQTQQLREKKMQLKSQLKDRFKRDIDLCREKYVKPYFRDQILKSAIYV